MENHWQVITGGPCSGKTTLVNELASRGYQTVTESAREYIASELAKGVPMEVLRADQALLQSGIFDLKLIKEDAAPREGVVFLDRGLPDTRAYCRVHAVSESELMAKAIETARYENVFVLDSLPMLQDEIRTESEEEKKILHESTLNVYKELGFNIISVPVGTIEERVDFVLSRLKK
ncbi:MAG: hypothetical protein JWN64_774 [Parcubacteria group bacterium]|nr:hypothetical protein [Parcubacteria group bacterium]